MRKAKNPQQMRPTRTEKKVMPQTKKKEIQIQIQKRTKKERKKKLGKTESMEEIS
jgi:hypothetical protein